VPLNRQPQSGNNSPFLRPEKPGNMMRLDTVIFDMDGLLIDSEPLWYEAGIEVLGAYGKTLTKTLYEQTTGLRTEEWLQYWFRYFDIPFRDMGKAKTDIEFLVEQKIRRKGKPLPGIDHIFKYFVTRGFKIGLATSSATKIATTVTDVLGIGHYLNTITSAEHLEYG
jgi:sugar-phosphatase